MWDRLRYRSLLPTPTVRLSSTSTTHRNAKFAPTSTTCVRRDGESRSRSAVNFNYFQRELAQAARRRRAAGVIKKKRTGA